jgi:hypothetical protein
MPYENLSRDELREIAKKRGVSDFATFSKSKLVRILNSLDETSPVIGILPEEVIREVVKENKEQSKENKQVISTSTKLLSSQAKNWKIYLEKLGISPKEYLIRYPDHVNKRFIEELLN